MRIGLAGVGVAGTSHLLDLVTNDQFDVIAVCAASQERAEEAARTFGVPHAYAGLEILLGAHRLDGVVLATPPSVTSVLLRSAVAAGLTVVVDKPAATNAAELRAATEGCPGPKVSVAYNRRYQPHLHEARRLLAANALGRLTEIECHWSGPFTQRYSSSETFRRYAGFGDGVLLDTGCHVIDTLLFLGLGPLSVTEARLRAHGTFADVEAQLGLTGAGGVPIAVNIGEGTDETWRLTLRGSFGFLTIDRSHLVRSTGERTNAAGQDEPPRPVDDLLRLSSGERPYGASLVEAADCLAVIDAARRLALRRRKPWRRPRAKALGRLNGAC